MDIQEIISRIVYYLVPAAAGIAVFRFCKRKWPVEKGINWLAVGITGVVLVAVMYLFNVKLMGWLYPRLIGG